ncbi:MULTISPECIES: hypothetical protein [unclassified Paenibacillus]|uniref:hypothetical protein n=1 Tax=unclassified Paenibacillus TaxID=185978 RepID=UPI0009A81848|nr:MULTISPECIES: hypothetical protein [unclassified Paenibacillus]SLK12945.1 hypothetical protein SAMN06272722_10820 [Paenibacillus sp. RU5A]SOC72767.1 hypothetical protein SAMN05880581_10820 [Paenibacillus sp. RU26A]SOC75046.1 hypothetical protein SAMN05880586_10820 [Paenibacillus sp. RU5M]
MNNIGIYITLISAITVAYLTYRNQMKLKAFEIFLKRREDVLSDIEKYLEMLHQVKLEIDLDNDEKKPNLTKFSTEYFHGGLILFHKIKGANFGELSNILASNFWTLINERLTNNKLDKDEFLDWIHRIQNILSTLYGFAHSTVNSEIQSITLPLHKKTLKYWKERRKTRNLKDEQK